MPEFLVEVWSRWGWRPVAVCTAAVLLVVPGSAGSDRAAARRVSADAGSSAPGANSVVALEGPDAVAALPLRSDGVFALSYTHSAYAAPAAEIFAVSGERFTLRAVASPNEAVLDYYALPGRRQRAGQWWVLWPTALASYDQLPLIATPVGRRTLVSGRRCAPLYPSHGARQLTIRIARAPESRGGMPCAAGLLAGLDAAGMAALTNASHRPNDPLR